MPTTAVNAMRMAGNQRLVEFSARMKITAQSTRMKSSSAP